MPKRPANFTQADIARAIRAMKAEGARDVRVIVRPDGGFEVAPTERQRPYYEQADTVAEDDEAVIL